ncbi:MAG: histidinol-phosphatase [Lachnospiraceae bacterium]|nr:histidinol-phosphatase [Lachnospiraceae bacterium]
MEKPYFYETHMHTLEGSACAHNTGAEMARAYKEAGYTGIIITDHFFYGNTAVDRSLAWEDWVEQYCKGYENAKKVGDEIGLQVFFGWESAYHGTEFLVYGLDKEWLKSHPEIKDATIEEQYALVSRDGGMVIHAHPYREASYIPEIRLFPKYVDGVEGINASHRSREKRAADGSPLYDAQALEYAAKHHLPVTGGSDTHTTKLLGGGTAFARRLDDIYDFIKAVKNGEGEPLKPWPREENL